MDIIGEIKRALIYTIAYADVFDYPLTAPEIHRYLTGAKASFEEVSEALNRAHLRDGLISRVEQYFVLAGREETVKTRQRRTQVSTELWHNAVRYGRILASLPFVRMVAVTGSLAMNNADKGRDIDYMLVTAPDHLWTCRAMSLLVGRFARLGGVNLCPNYLVTENALELTDRSLYVARELAQMIPLSGMETYNDIRRLNAWADDYLPNAHGSPDMPILVKGPSRLQRVLEFVLTRFPIQRFERWEMNRKIARFSHQTGFGPETNFTAEICQGNFDQHGSWTMKRYNERLFELGISSTLPLGEGLGVREA